MEQPMVIKITVDELATFKALINNKKIQSFLTENIQRELNSLDKKLEQSFNNKGVLVWHQKNKLGRM